MELGLTHTLILLGVVSLFTLLCGWRGAQPMNPLKGPRMVPWRFMMLLSFTLGMLLVVHLMALFGFSPPPQSF